MWTLREKLYSLQDITGGVWTGRRLSVTAELQRGLMRLPAVLPFGKPTEHQHTHQCCACGEGGQADQRASHHCCMASIGEQWPSSFIASLHMLAILWPSCGCRVVAAVSCAQIVPSPMMLSAGDFVSSPRTYAARAAFSAAEISLRSDRTSASCCCVCCCICLIFCG